MKRASGSDWSPPGSHFVGRTSRRPRRALAALAVLLAVGAAAAAETPMPSVYAGVGSRSLLTVLIEPRLRWLAGLLGRETMVGVRAEIPALLAVAGEMDTASLSLVGAQELLGTPQTDASPRRGISASLLARASIGLDAQSQVLGRFWSIVGSVGLDGGFRTPRLRAGLVVRWTGAIVTVWEPSDGVAATFTRSGATPPQAGLLGPDRGRVFYGMSFLGAITTSVLFEAEILGVVTPGSFAGGFNGMMFGQWPFSLTLGMRIAVGRDAGG